jgi:TRAP-type C4-dicarboxylate transport system substrate-binding protein
VTETGQPAIFAITEISRKWYDALPADLRQIIDSAAAAEVAAINPQAIEINSKARQVWIDGGGELITFPPEEQASMLKIMAGVGDEVSNTKPLLAEAYKIVTEAAAHAK